MQLGLFLFFSIFHFSTFAQERIEFIDKYQVYTTCVYYKSRLDYIDNLAKKTEQYVDSISEHFSTHSISSGCFGGINEEDLKRLQSSRQKEIELADSLINRSMNFWEQEVTRTETELNTKLTIDLQQFSKYSNCDTILTAPPMPSEAVNLTLEFIAYSNQKKP